MASELKEQEAINHLQRIEIRFHIAKLITIIVVSIFTAMTIIYFVRQDNQRTRTQINCVVNGFLQPEQDIPAAVNKCKE